MKKRSLIARNAKIERTPSVAILPAPEAVSPTPSGFTGGVFLIPLDGSNASPEFMFEYNGKHYTHDEFKQVLLEEITAKVGVA